MMEVGTYMGFLQEICCDSSILNVQFCVRDSEAQLGLLLWGGNILLCNGWGRGGVKGGFPPFSKIFQKQKFFYKGLSRKKGNFKMLHADLAVFNSNRFFVLVFLQNLYFQQL